MKKITVAASPRPPPSPSPPPPRRTSRSSRARPPPARSRRSTSASRTSATTRARSRSTCGCRTGSTSSPTRRCRGGRRACTSEKLDSRSTSAASRSTSSTRASCGGREEAQARPDRPGPVPGLPALGPRAGAARAGSQLVFRAFQTYQRGERVAWTGAPDSRRAGPARHAPAPEEALSARYEIDGDVAEIVIAHPPLNLFGPAMLDRRRRGRSSARAAAERPRALIVRAEGDVFSAGVDVHVFDGLDAERRAGAHRRACWRSPTRSRTCRCPTLAVVHGLCLTAGLELSLACDLLWAAEGAQFGLVEKVVGITPLMGGTQRMAERAGTRARARVRDDRRALRRRRRCTVGRREPRRCRRTTCSRSRAGSPAELAAGPDGRARGDQGDRARAGRPRHARRRRAHRGADLTPVRDRGLHGSGRNLPRQAPERRRSLADSAL